MGFEWSLEAAGRGNAERFVDRGVKERIGEADGGWSSACSGCGNGVFSLWGHTPGMHAGAGGASNGLNLWLRGIKKADPPFFFPQHLCGGQSLNYTHWPLAFRTLPNRQLRGGL
jgi:hypothetical protein